MFVNYYMLKKNINSAKECELLGYTIANKLNQGDVISLEGDLGSGKTTFVKGILRGLNYKYDVTSPTFTLINEYNSLKNVIHIDCYKESDLGIWIMNQEVYFIFRFIFHRRRTSIFKILISKCNSFFNFTYHYFFFHPSCFIAVSIRSKEYLIPDLSSIAART